MPEVPKEVNTAGITQTNVWSALMAHAMWLPSSVALTQKFPDTGSDYDLNSALTGGNKRKHTVADKSAWNLSHSLSYPCALPLSNPEPIYGGKSTSPEGWESLFRVWVFVSRTVFLMFLEIYLTNAIHGWSPTLYGSTYNFFQIYDDAQGIHVQQKLRKILNFLSFPGLAICRVLLSCDDR